MIWKHTRDPSLFKGQYGPVTLWARCSDDAQWCVWMDSQPRYKGSGATPAEAFSMLQEQVKREVARLRWVMALPSKGPRLSTHWLSGVVGGV